jgi:hypothetical protein
MNSNSFYAYIFSLVICFQPWMIDIFVEYFVLNILCYFDYSLIERLWVQTVILDCLIKISFCIKGIFCLRVMFLQTVCLSGYEHGIWYQTVLIWILTLLITSCVTLGKKIFLRMFPHL